jgi:hypothetical protein
MMSRNTREHASLEMLILGIFNLPQAFIFVFPFGGRAKVQRSALIMMQIPVHSSLVHKPVA